MNCFSTVSLSAIITLAAVAACSSPPPAIVEQAGSRAPQLGGHVGPAVDSAATGPARLVDPLLASFDERAAIAERTDARPGSLIFFQADEPVRATGRS